MNGVKARKLLGILLLPRVIPRARALFASGFGYIAFLMANIYSSVRLLPRNHPYVNPANIGRYGIRHVIGEAANNLVIKKENADQIVIFLALLLGIGILLMQIVMIIYGFVIHPAMAAAATSLFLTPDPTTGGGNTPDIAFVVLDRVFGIPDLFCTIGNVCTTVNGTLPWPFHSALHELFRFYSEGMLIVGVVIFLYYVLVVVGETATTGSPFGQRFQNAWVPIRLVVALGLLIPIQWGLNSGQYIVLYAAKYGSGFATNAWLQFNSIIAAQGTTFASGAAANPTGERDSLLAKPQPTDVMAMVQTMSIVNACAYAYWKVETNSANEALPPTGGFIKPYFVKSVEDWMTNSDYRQEVLTGTTYANALAFYNKSDIVIRFGRADDTNSDYDSEKGKVKPLCGDVRIPINYVKTIGQGNTVGGPDMMQEFYYRTILNMWFNAGLIRNLPQRYIEVALNREPHTQCSLGCGSTELPACGGGAAAPCQKNLPDFKARQELLSIYNANAKTAVFDAWDRYNRNATDIEMTTAVKDRGWAGAGIWYNTIAEVNGAFVTAIVSVPTFESYPYVMEKVREDKRKNDKDPSSKNQFKPNLANGQPVTIEGGTNVMDIARVLNDFFEWWNKEDPNSQKPDQTVTGSGFTDAITVMFGTTGLFAMRGENAHIHPLAQLAAVGKSLVDSAIINIGTSTITAGLGGLIRMMDPNGAGPVADLISSITMSVAFIGLTAGFILYYVLPFLPFLYFFFAFSTWVKSIFEAMVGVPLWALAHLRLDGEGLPGDSASSGYFLIFEIFIRPILTVFGLVASILILTAQVRMLNVLWTLVIDNMTGFENISSAGADKGNVVAYHGVAIKSLPRNKIDEFFFTIVYTIIVYMMATASFKMIDKIPDQLLRFMGAGVSAFSDINPDPTEGLTRYAALGGITVGQQATQGLQSMASQVGGGLAEELGGAVKAIQGKP